LEFTTREWSSQRSGTVAAAAARRRVWRGAEFAELLLGPSFFGAAALEEPRAVPRRQLARSFEPRKLGQKPERFRDAVVALHRPLGPPVRRLRVCRPGTRKGGRRSSHARGGEAQEI
jgi:hypothetical protein